MLLFVIAVAPPLLLFWLVAWRRRQSQVYRRWVGRTLVWGMWSALPAALIEIQLLPSEVLAGNLPLGPLFLVCWGIGLIEEGTKFAAVLGATQREPAVRYVRDGIMAGVAGSLGFATLENVFYILPGGWSLGVARALLAVPGHALLGASLGYFVGRAYRTTWPQARPLLVRAFLVMSFLHAVYDWLALSQSWLTLGLIPFIYWLSRCTERHLQNARRLDRESLREAMRDEG
jgi:RsiW-degrading membrane proteinase PrsW (M82 family)